MNAATGIVSQLRPRGADRRLLPEGRLSGPMPWVLAIMLFITTLATAGGIGLGAASRQLGGDLADRATVQIVTADPVALEAQATAAMAALGSHPAVRAVDRLAPTEMAQLLEPWLGPGGSADLPLPALIDITLAQGHRDLPAVAAVVRRVAPAARIDDHGAALAPLAGLIGTLRWIAVLLVLLMMLATACTVVLAAAAALDTHRATIDVMHLLGATDVQIARLFQRRIALDTLFAGLIGLGAGCAVLWALARQLAGLGSELFDMVALPAHGWVLVAALPLVATLLAMLAARWTVLRALQNML